MPVTYCVPTFCNYCSRELINDPTTVETATCCGDTGSMECLQASIIKQNDIIRRLLTRVGYLELKTAFAYK